MKHEEFEKMSDSLYTGAEMTIEKITIFCKEKDKFSLMELGEMTDMLKDLSETQKNIAKTGHLLDERPTERF